MKYALVLEEFYTPANGGRSYSSERIVCYYDEQTDASNEATKRNWDAAPNEHYSIRKVEN